ncbi:hypothetical protein, partial [Parasutterella excrementihominis]|uniref:hypothetical protein n=1 Tax=Parasutterella excrementihominis TaxID=487175 RepID=UPI003078646D
KSLKAIGKNQAFYRASLSVLVCSEAKTKFGINTAREVNKIFLRSIKTPFGLHNPLMWLKQNHRELSDWYEKKTISVCLIKSTHSLATRTTRNT